MGVLDGVDYSCTRIPSAHSGIGIRRSALGVLGTHSYSHTAGAPDTVITDAESAGYIAAGVSAFVAAALKLRTVISGDRRKIAHDDNATKWENSILEENESLRKRIAEQDVKHQEAWLRHVQDVQRISQLETEQHYLRQEVGHLKAEIAQMRKGRP